MPSVASASSFSEYAKIGRMFAPAASPCSMTASMNSVFPVSRYER